MKKRWMKSIIETSKKEAPALPYHRASRQAAKLQMSARVLKSA